jgi:hypothetical protein
MQCCVLHTNGKQHVRQLPLLDPYMQMQTPAATLKQRQEQREQPRHGDTSQLMTMLHRSTRCIKMQVSQ